MIETKKLNDSTLKRTTKSNNTYEDVHITDVPSNVISHGKDSLSKNMGCFFIRVNRFLF